MATGKRASMREGPLAALFRKTAEDAGETGEPPVEEGGEAQAKPQAPPAPQTPAARAEGAAPGPGEPPGEDEPARPVPSPHGRRRQAVSPAIPSGLPWPAPRG